MGAGGPSLEDSAEGEGGLRRGQHPLQWALSGEGSRRPGLMSVPAAICPSAHSDPQLEPGPHRTGLGSPSATLSDFAVVVKHNEVKPDGLREGMGLEGWSSWREVQQKARWPDRKLSAQRGRTESEVRQGPL